MNTNPSTSLRESHSPDFAIEAILLRVGLASAGGLLLHLVCVIVSSAPLSKSPGDVLILIVSGISGLFLLAIAGLRRPPSFFRWLILLACIGELVVRSVIWAQTSGGPDLVTIDLALHTDMAGELLRHGENPYTWDLSGIFELCRISQEASTPRLNAAKVNNFHYPALPFLLVIPFQALNLPGTFLVSVVAHTAALVLLFWASPRLVQPLILLPILVGVDFTSLTLIGVFDIVWVALLVGMVVAWRRPTLRAVLFGLAAAFKQSPWLVAPFLVIRIWRDEDGGSPIRQIGHFLVISGITFLIINGPFMMWSPEAWLQGVTGPLRDDLVLLSQGGLSSLTQFGFVYLPKSYYLIATLSVLGLLLFCYWRHYDILRHALWIMPGIFMWFSYRSLVSYWVYWVFPMLATLVTHTPPSGTVRDRPQRENKPDWGPTLATTTAVLGVLLVTGILLSLSPATIEAHPLFPLHTTHGQVTSMNVEVVNRSRRILIPRFAVQHRYATGNPLPWTIDQGPLSLSPGQSAVYRVSTNRHDRSFFAHDAAQLIITDGQGDHSLRDVVTIGPDTSLLWPDAIPNPAYLFWNSNQSAPIFWELIADPPGSGTVSPENRERQGTLRLTLNTDSEGISQVALQNLVTIPLNPFGIWVYSDPPSENPSSVAYGLEIDDGQHRLWFLFGSQAYAGPLEEGQYVINRTVPPRRWVYQEIDVLAAYAEAGWQLPDLKPAVHRGLDIDLRLVNLRLLLAADGPIGNLQAYFGPIEQDVYRIEPQTLMADTLGNPISYYVRLAGSYVGDRNYFRALEAYQRALEFSPNDPIVLDGIDRVMQHLAVESSK